MSIVTLALTSADLQSAIPSQTLWWLNRATGIVLLAQLTLVVLLGVLATGRNLPWRVPSFVSNELHRNMALMTLALLIVHIGTSILDSYVEIDIWDSVIPFASPYRPTWLGLGTLAFDLMLALFITTALRSRMPERAWRLVHITVYLAWLLAVLHGLGIGTDAKNPAFIALNVVCILSVVIALGARIAAGAPWPRTWRMVAIGLVAVVPAAIAVWAIQGPLAPGWKDKAGTPSQVSSAGVMPQQTTPIEVVSHGTV